MKIFLFFFYFFLFFLTFTTVIYSDSFYENNGDFLYNEVYLTPILYIDEDLDFTNENYILVYEEEDIEGLYNPVLGNNVLWEDHVVNFDGRLRRKVGVNDRVMIAPHTRVGLSAILKNNSGHDVNIYSWWVYISDYEMDDNWNNFGLGHSEAMVAFRFAGEVITMRGRAFEVFAGDVLETYDGEITYNEIASFDISQPLEVVNYDYEFFLDEEGELVLAVQNEVHNLFDGEVTGVEYEHLGYSLERDFMPSEKFLYEYEVNLGHDYNIGLNEFEGFEINIPKYSECIAEGSVLNEDNFNPDTRTMLIRRDDCNSHPGWKRRISDLDFYPEGDAMCIEVLPHKLVGLNLEHYISEEVYEDIDVYFSEEIDKNIFLEEGLVFVFFVENNSDLYLNNLGIELKYADDFQVLNSSSCTFDDGIVVISELSQGALVKCELIFDVSPKRGFLILENKLVLDEEVFDKSVFRYYPDLEFELFYEDEEFFFNSIDPINTFLEQEEVAIAQYDFCKRFSVLGLYRIICPL